MKKKLFSIILVICLLLGTVVLPTQASGPVEEAASPEGLVQVQDLTGPRFQGLNVTYWYENLVYYNMNGACGVMDVFGNSVLAPVYQGISYLRDGYFSFVKNDKCALFYKAKQLTDFRYEKLDEMLLCFRGKLGESYEFLDENGKKIPVPTVNVPDRTVIDIIPYKAILLYKEEYYTFDEYLGGILRHPARYQVLDWRGNALTKDTSDRIRFADDNSFILSAYYKEERVYLDESIADIKPECPEGYGHAWGTQQPGNRYYILTKSDEWGNTYYLFDTDYKEICKLEVYVNAYQPVVSLTEDLFIVRRTAEKSVVMNAQGQVVKDITGGFVTFVGQQAWYNIDAPTDRYIVCDGVNSYLYDVAGDQIAELSGATGAENEGCYITAELGNGQYALYDIQGNLLFEYDNASPVEVRCGVILQEGYAQRSAVLNSRGEPLTEYQFTLCQNTGTFGLIYVKIKGRSGFYLVNSAGQILNEEGYDEPPHVSGSYCEYKIGGKTGILRIVGPGDDMFADVPTGTWYHDAVEACAKMELFNGTAPGRFSPEKTMTRAMLVTVLWRLDGQQAPKEAANFADVAGGSWYADAVAWASENGIVNGVGKGKFNPDGSVTREQIATILRRYAESKGIDTTAQADLSGYPDVGDVSSYATEAMAWANAAGLINGNKISGAVYLQPKGNATRAQVAAILMRYVEE
ncbi:MAG: S-layer homology domain-containing protein [Oscillospiraceae bacterium]|nr:S-layer homology domain-containing protein [Oscillospiraceae bacterium]